MDEKAHRVTIRNDGAVLHVDIDVTVCDFQAIYHLAEKDVSDTGGLVRVRVLAQNKTVLFSELILEGIGNEAPSDIIGVWSEERILRRRDRTRMELGVRVHGTKTHCLATRNGALVGKNRAHKPKKGQRYLWRGHNEGRGSR